MSIAEITTTLTGAVTTIKTLLDHVKAIKDPSLARDVVAMITEFQSQLFDPEFPR